MKIITGVTVEEQMKRAKKILEEVVIPRNNKYRELMLKKNKNFNSIYI
jgi:hypothetical protein